MTDTYLSNLPIEEQKKLSKAIEDSYKRMKRGNHSGVKRTIQNKVGVKPKRNKLIARVVCHIDL